MTEQPEPGDVGTSGRTGIDRNPRRDVVQPRHRVDRSCSDGAASRIGLDRRGDDADTERLCEDQLIADA